MPNPSRRCLVVVLEGIGHAELLEVVQSGGAPTLGGLMAGGMLLPVAAPYPPVAAVAWSTFMTASLPGKHGVFGLTHPQNDLGVRFTDARDLRMPTLWDRAATDGLRSVVVNLPATYPARRMSGMLVSGFVAPVLERACHPAPLGRDLAAGGYIVDVDATLAHSDPVGFSRQVGEVLQRRIWAMEKVLDSERWSLGILAFTEADRLNRMWYQRIRERDGIEFETYQSWVREVDAFISRTGSRFSTANVVVLSGYGFSPVRRFVNLDAWLQANGYLSFDAAGGIAPASRAFSMDPGRIYVASAQVFDRGAVPKEDVMRLVDDIADGLSQLVDPETGSMPIATIRKRRHAYEGARTYQAPNLICLPAPGYELKTSRRLPLFSDATFEGTHTKEGAILLQGGGPHAPTVTLEDAGATILAALGLHDDDVDGSSLLA